MLNQDIIKGKWKQIKGQIKTKWGKLTDDDLDQINGRAEELSGRLQQRYGWNKEEAKKAVEDFQNTPH